MKKLLLPALLAFFTTVASAQSFRFGAKGGFNYSDINGKNLDKSHREKLGWHAGLMVNIQYPGNDWFSVQPELIYTRKGYENFSDKTEVKDQSNNLLYTEQQAGLIGLNYLELPVMFNFRTGILVFEAGPQVSYLVGFKNDAVTNQMSADGSETNTPSQFRRYSEDRLNKFDYGFATGLRLEAENGAALGVRYSQGFRKIAKNDKEILLPTEPFIPNAKNQVFQLYVSYLIPE